MTTKCAFRALDAPTSPASPRGRPFVEELALPKSVESCNLGVNDVVIRWMSDQGRRCGLKFGPIIAESLLAMAIKVFPLPKKGSSTISPRVVHSRMRFVMSATGFGDSQTRFIYDASCDTHRERNHDVHFVTNFCRIDLIGSGHDCVRRHRIGCTGC
jgi:hypothetical protein